jgi:hypothetical protein
MSQFAEFGLPDDEPSDEQADIAAQIAEAEAAEKAAKQKVAELRRRRGAAEPPAGNGTPEAGPGQVDLDALLSKVSDRSRPWPEIEAELAATHGFRSSTPAPSARGIRPGGRRPR